MLAGMMEYGDFVIDFPATATAIKHVKDNTVVGLAPRGSGRRGIWSQSDLVAERFGRRGIFLQRDLAR